MPEIMAGIISVHPRYGRGLAIRRVINKYQEKERPSKLSLKCQGWSENIGRY